MSGKGENWGRNKFRANVERDARHEREWVEMCWSTIIIWECGLKTEKERERVFRKVGKWLEEFKATR